MSTASKRPRAESSSTTPMAMPIVDAAHSSATLLDASGMAYRRIQELGEGGTARAVLAYRVGTSGVSKLVVLKILHKQLAEDPPARAMFEAEARLSARLNHPNLVQVYEVVNTEIPFLVMEYLDGKPLSRVLSAGALTQTMLLTILAEALIGLHHAHELCDFDGTPFGIVHRDISPHNIFVTYDGAVKVLDFGIAKATGAVSRTETGEVKGKLAYMAPEQLLGQKIDRRTDIFAAGCILWEAAVGGRFWGEMTDYAVMHRLATGQIPRPDESTGMDARLVQIVVKATATVPEERYATALEMQRDLAAFLAERGEPSALRDAGASLALTFKEERERNRKLLGSVLSGPLTMAADEATHSRSGERPAGFVPSRGRGRWMGFAAAAFALMTISAWLSERYFRSKGQAVVTNPLPAPPATSRVRVRATPAGASVAIDGSDRGHAPVLAEVTADAQDHTIRVSAPGYRADTRTLKFSRDLDIEISLEKLAPEVASGGTIASATPTTNELHHAAAPKPKNAAPAEDSRCTPPYYFANGIKTFKPECL